MGGNIALSGKHELGFNFSLFQRPPSLRSVYPNPRETHQYIPNLNNENGVGIELNYHWTSSWFDLNILGYWIQHENVNHDNSSSLVSSLLSIKKLAFFGR